MIRAGLLLIWLCVVSPLHAQTIAAPPGFDSALAARVYTAALGFMEPRLLEPVAVPQLVLWGLRGLNTIDPQLGAGVSGGGLALFSGNRLLLLRPIPPGDSASEWGDIAADFCAAAWEASAAIRRVGEAGLLQSFFDELFSHLDPYSRYVPPGTAIEDRANRTGTVGAGLLLGLRRGSLIVEEAIAGGPAALAGIQPGDRLLAVDGRSTRGVSAKAIAGWLVGPEGSTVTLTWQGRDRRPRTAELIRKTVPPETVFSERVGNMLVVHVTRFDRSTASHLASAISEALASPRKPAAIVLDLRGNRGGLLQQAVQAADVLLPAGIVAVTAGRNPEAARTWLSAEGDLAGDIPVIVLVDGRTASAAEVLAAALADRGRAVVVGSSTLGKGLAQTIAQLPDGGELFVTWSRILAPDGWPLQGLGVLPQVCTSLGEDDLRGELADLANGIQPMARALARQRNARAPVPPAEILAIRGACPAAEGGDRDMNAARFLADHPRAYATALLAPL